MRGWRRRGLKEKGEGERRSLKRRGGAGKGGGLRGKRMAMEEGGTRIRERGEGGQRGRGGKCEGHKKGVNFRKIWERAGMAERERGTERERERERRGGK